MLAESPPKDDAERTAIAQAFASGAAMLPRWERDVRQVPEAKIIELPGANLYMFISNEADVSGFAASLPRN